MKPDANDTTGRYRKLKPRWWMDVAPLLSANAKIVALYCLSGPWTTAIGLARFSPGAAAEDCGLSTESFRESFDEACRVQGWKFDAVARVLWIPSWLADNPPQNPNVVKSWQTCFNEVPNCDLKLQAGQHVTSFLKAFPEGFRKAFPNGLVNGSANGIANQEQEQDQDQERSKHTVTTSDDRADADIEPVACAGTVELTERDREFVESRPLLPSEPATWSDATALADGFVRPTHTVTIPPDAFEAFWAAYPRKVGKVAAAKAWKVAAAIATAPEILSGLAKWKASRQWREVLATDPELTKIPHATTWLNQRRWQEPPATALEHETANGGTVMQKELVRLLDAVGVKRYDRQWFDQALIAHDNVSGEATIVIADDQRREYVERNFHEPLEAAVIAQGGRRLRICGSAAA